MSVIEHTVQAQLVTRAPEPRPLRVLLRYDPRNAFAVSVTFPAPACLDGVEAVWTFSRDLLATGLGLPAGEGDVRLRPAGPHRTALSLHAAEGIALLEVDTPGVRAFLDAAYDRVPQGAERVGSHELDRDLAELLRGV
ncbi:SsgA family sporulation/cell division regulator [Streptomyces sp. RKND-216]|uniref:SsgA family sporulation/cell division regulator n=1 Tax=Streptomyces sp. RKND-216 TaxID=2562581 RepID=UPI001FFB570B|nr:SsgA family sporulation/cell division regulator [Streptomyces sp. RKND-216]